MAVFNINTRAVFGSQSMASMRLSSYDNKKLGCLRIDFSHEVIFPEITPETLAGTMRHSEAQNAEGAS